MNIKNINYFMAIVEEGSVSAAARKLFISQQALSEQLKKLEEELGCLLFKRGNNKFTLTDAGKYFYNGCKKLSNDYNSIMLDLKAIDYARHNNLSIAFPTYGFPPYLPDFLNQFQVKYPQYKLNIVKRQHADIETHMDGVDLYFSALPLKQGLDNEIIIADDPYNVVFSRSLAERIYGDKTEDVLEELSKTRSLEAVKELPYAIVHDRYGELAMDLNMIFTENNFDPVIGLASEHLTFCDSACINGRCAIIIPQSHAHYLLGKQAEGKDLLAFLIDVKNFDCSLAVTHPSGLHLHPAEKAMIEEFKAFAAENLVP